MRRLTVMVFVFLLVSALSWSAIAADACRPQLQAGWIRKPPVPDASAVAGYGTLANPCTDDALIVSMQSPVFASVSLHRSMVMDGMAMMHELPSLPLAAGKRVVLQSGSYHLMLTSSSKALKEGDVVPVTFTLDDGTTFGGQLTVRESAP